MKKSVISTLLAGLALGTLTCLTPQRAQAQHLDFSGGFLDPTSMTLNGGESGASILPDGKLQLSDGKLWRRGSAFSKTRVDVDVFYAKFRFELIKGIEHEWGPMADGITITFHNSPDGPFAIGPPGGGLGYGPDFKSNIWWKGIPNSVAVKFDTYQNDGEHADYTGYGDFLFGWGPQFRFAPWWGWYLSNSTGLYFNGEAPTNYPELGRPAYDLTPDGIDFHSGRVFETEMVYDGTVLKVTISDTQTGASSTQSYTVDIPAVVGGKRAYVGFTGSTGVFTAFQNVLNLAVNKVSYGELCELLHHFVTKRGVAHSLCSMLEAAAAAEARGDWQAKEGMVNAFIKEVQAQTGKTILPGYAAILIKLASAL